MRRRVKRRYSCRICPSRRDGGKVPDQDGRGDATTTTRGWRSCGRASMEGGVGDDDKGGSLDWETFEFSTSSKMDRRFAEVDASLSQSNVTGIPNGVLDTVPSDSVTYLAYVKWGADVNKATSANSIRSRSNLLSLPPDVVRRLAPEAGTHRQGPRRADPPRLIPVRESLESKQRLCVPAHAQFLWDTVR